MSATKTIPGQAAPPPPPDLEEDHRRPPPNDRLSVLLVLHWVGGANLHLVNTLTGIPFERIRRAVDDLHDEGLVRLHQMPGRFEERRLIGRVAARWLPDFLRVKPPAGVPEWARATAAALTDAGRTDPEMVEAEEEIARERAESARAFWRAPLRSIARGMAEGFVETVEDLRRTRGAGNKRPPEDRRDDQ